MWRTEQASELAAEHLSDLGPRWSHIQTVGRLADQVVKEHGLSTEIAAAAWLHDIGYAPALLSTGFHPVDGAAFLAAEGAPDQVVSLVAHHTEARFEAEERGLQSDLARFPLPNADDLDTLTLLDLVTSPTGELTTPEKRVAEILSRYPDGHPVNRAVTRSQSELLASAARARARLGLSDVWPGGFLETLGDTQSH